MISKLTRMFLVTLLCVTAVTTASSQDNPSVIDPAVVARGEALANEDPLALELRNQQPEATPRGSPRRGFDIGMAIAEGQTLPGPGKDKTCASLHRGDQQGCRIAVSFSVERNRNAVLAYRGAAIAKADSAAARMRNATSNVFYKLGFDIGLAASERDTLPGPGKDRLRDSLLPALREGFSSAVSFTLERNRNSAVLGATWETTAGPAQKAASNEIRCRGYSRTGGSEFVFFTINSRSSQTGETIVTYEIAFTPGTRAAGTRGEGLQPGDCAWADRPIGDSGPFRIRFETVANAQLKQQLRGDPVDRSTTAAESYPDVKTIPIYLKGDNRYWSFGGITNARSYFIATGHGYWKPAIAVGDVIRSPTEPAQPKGRVPFPPKP